MSKENVLKEFETDFTDPGSVKSGEYLESHVLARARTIIEKDRAGLIAALEEWLEMNNEPKTMLAVKVANEMRLKELIPSIEKLRERIESGKAFFPFYMRWVDEALDSLKKDVP